MSREIKFRVWDNQKSNWANRNDIDYANVLDFPVHDYFLLDQKERNRWEFMQYTGLKDKHGKEIYIGDIISYNDYSGPIPITPGAKIPKTISTVEAPENMFKGIQLKGNGYSEPKDIEIIGNIYENPELLENEQA